MRPAFGVSVVLALFILAPAIGAQNTARDAKAIAKVKTLDVSRLDKRLSHQPFSKWFGDVIGKSGSVEWEVNDCGEQDGSGRQKDFPICVQAMATVERVEITIQIAVGTHKRGLVGTPVVWGIWVGASGAESQWFDKLSEVSPELVRMKQRGS